jgi:hypothetical protein
VSLGGASDTRVVEVEAGESTVVVFAQVRPYPLADRAVAHTTFPTSPLPPGMSDPNFAVDADETTAWYVAVTVGEWEGSASAGLVELSAHGPGTTPAQRLEELPPSYARPDTTALAEVVDEVAGVCAGGDSG